MNIPQGWESLGPWGVSGWRARDPATGHTWLTNWRCDSSPAPYPFGDCGQYPILARHFLPATGAVAGNDGHWFLWEDLPLVNLAAAITTDARLLEFTHALVDFSQTLAVRGFFPSSWQIENMWTGPVTVGSRAAGSWLWITGMTAAPADSTAWRQRWERDNQLAGILLELRANVTGSGQSLGPGVIAAQAAARMLSSSPRKFQWRVTEFVHSSTLPAEYEQIMLRLEALAVARRFSIPLALMPPIEPSACRSEVSDQQPAQTEPTGENTAPLTNPRQPDAVALGAVLVTLSEQPEQAMQLGSWLVGQTDQPPEIAQLLLALIERQDIQPSVDGWKLQPLLTVFRGPVSADSGLGLLPALDPLSARVIEFAAAFGGPFSSRLAKEVLNEANDRIETTLSLLVQQGIFTVLTTGEHHAYRLSSLAVKAAAASQITPAQWQQWHRSLADHLYVVTGRNRPVVLAISLARHFHQAGLTSRAEELLAEVAADALAGGQVNIGLQVQSIRAELLLPGQAPDAAWQVMTAEMFQRSGEIDNAMQAALRGTPSDPQVDSQLSQRAAAVLAVCHGARGAHNEAEGLLSRLIEPESASVSSRLLLAAAEVALAQGKEQIAGKYLDLIDQHVVAGSWEQEHSWVLRFELARHLEHEQQALAAIKTLQQLAIRSRHRLAGALAVFAAGRLNAISGPSRQARIELETSADLFRGLGAQGWADAAEEELARLDIRDGRWAEAVTGWVNVGYRRLRAGAVRDAARCFAYQIATLAMVNRINSARETTVALDRLAQQENVLFRAAQLFDAGAADLFAAARGTATWLGSWPGVAAAGVSADAIKPATQISQWMANITRSREMKQDNGATGQTRPNGPGVGCWEDRLTVARALATIESGQPLDHSPLMDVHARLRRGGWPFFAGLAALVAAEAYVAGAGRANRENKFWDKGFQTLSAQLGWADKHFRSSGAASLAVRSAKAIKALNSIVLPLAIEGHDDAQRLAVLLRVIGCLRAQTTPDLMLEKVLGEVASYLGACLGMLFLWERHGVNLSVKAKLGHPRLTANHVRQLVNAWAADGLGQFRVRVVRSAEELPPALQADLGTVLPIVFMPVQLGTDAAGAMAFWSFSSPPGNQLLNDNFFAALADQLLLAGNRQLLSRRLREAVRISDLSERCSRLTKPLIGASSAMERVFTMIDKLKDSPSTVLIRGESGTGKELVARALHECGVREKKPFSAFFCGALARDIIEAELFGAARGAFTGAITDRPGLLEAADHGTVFLDEVSDIPLDTQAKLLRVLQEGEIRRVGSAAVRRIDVRFIAASNRPLEEDIEAGRLRKDLYYRLNVVSIELPPLRQRGGDIPLLANHFLAKYNKRLGKDVPGFTNEVEQFLTHYSWPGNVRELENAVEAAVNLAGFGESISWPHLPVRLVQAWRLMQSGKTQSDATVQWQRRELVIRTLSECDWVKIRAADRLGLSRQGLDKLMKRLDIKKF